MVCHDIQYPFSATEYPVPVFVTNFVSLDFNKTSIFDYSINKKNKYTKGDTIFYPIGKANWGNTIRFIIEKQG